MDPREYLETVIPTRDDVDRFLDRVATEDGYNANSGWTFDAGLGWLLKDSIRHDGIDDSRTFYHYEKSGCRKIVNFPDVTSRIHTYGNSFTHCDQVSDGETWQEYLAAHLREPIENYGIGGYSVYQAYLRMLQIERDWPAEYVILNIYDDDHFRNLDAWSSIRLGRKLTSGWTLPHLRLNVARNEFAEVPNLCQAPDDVYRLADLDLVVDTLGDDEVLGHLLAVENCREGGRLQGPAVATRFGLPVPTGSEEGVLKKLADAHTSAALFATRKTLELVEEFVGREGKKLMVVLSRVGDADLELGREFRRYLMGAAPWDQEFLDYLSTKGYPVVDLRSVHKEEYGLFGGSADAYLDRYYNVHYAPAGNFFCAMAVKQAVIEWLEPTSSPYL